MSDEDSESTPPPFPAGWEILATERRTALKRELLAEIAPGHAIFDKELSMVAACDGCDDALILIEDDHRWAFVHLTWTNSAETPPWPLTTLFAGRLPYGPMIEHAKHVLDDSD